MNAFERYTAICDMLFEACQTGRIESLAVIAIVTLMGSLLASSVLIDRPNQKSDAWNQKKPNWKSRLVKPELYAVSLAALFFVGCFLSFAAEGWDDHELLLLHTVRSALSAMLVFSFALVVIAAFKTLVLALPVIGWFVKGIQLMTELFNSVVVRDEPVVVTEPVTEVIEPTDFRKDQMLNAQLEFQQRLALIESSGLDAYEQEAVETQLKQEYLKNVRDIVKNQQSVRR